MVIEQQKVRLLYLLHPVQFIKEYRYQRLMVFFPYSKGDLLTIPALKRGPMRYYLPFIFLMQIQIVNVIILPHLYIYALIAAFLSSQLSSLAFLLYPPKLIVITDNSAYIYNCHFPQAPHKLLGVWNVAGIRVQKVSRHYYELSFQYQPLARVNKKHYASLIQLGLSFSDK